MASVASYMPSASSLALILLVAVICYMVSGTVLGKSYTVPLPSYKSGFVGNQAGSEGFTHKGTSQAGSEGFTIPEPSLIPPPPNCETEQAKALTAFFHGIPSTEEGGRDLEEFTHIVNKLSCFKKDLISPNYTVSATLKQPFITTHDVEPISETTGRCFAKTLPPRDLDIAMDKWTDRGGFLIRRLCTSFSLKDAQATQIETSFQAFLRDVYDTARDKCLQKEPLDVSKRGPRDPSPFSVRTDPQVGEFSGYY